MFFYKFLEEEKNSPKKYGACKESQIYCLEISDKMK